MEGENLPHFNTEPDGEDGKKVSHSSSAFCRKLGHFTQLGANLRARVAWKAKTSSK